MTGAPRRWALAASVMWDGSRRHEARAVVVEDDHIVSVESVDRLTPHIPVRRMDGCTVLPGLIDCHVHLADWMLPGFLAAGVTTVRDTGNDLSWILERRRRTMMRPLSGPRILCCGPLLDGPAVNWPTIGRVHARAEEVAGSVDELAGAGVDAIKLYVNLSPEQIASAVVAAHRRGLRVLAHLGSVPAQVAARAGVDEIEHLSGLVHHVHGVDGGDLSASASLSSSVPHGVVLCPTLVVWDRLSRVNDLVFANDWRSVWVHPDILSAWSRFPHRRIAVTERMNRQASVVAMKRVLESLDRASTPIIAGSDTPWPHVVPGFGLHDELALMVDAGLSEVEALTAATSAAADALGISDHVGRIKAGLDADLMIVGGDPTADIAALSDVRMVVRRGSLVDFEEQREAAHASFATAALDPVSGLIMDAVGD